VLPTAGHPIVIGEWRGAGPKAPTYLVYGHYDVQPVEPLELWHSPPFEPQVRDGRIYARGSVDDKGQLYLHVKALQAHLAVNGKLPVNVILLAEGEEEVGSEHLSAFIEQHARRLACDGVIISDSSMFAPGLPSILFSLLRPGAHITPHHGFTNARYICHLPLIVPEGCAMRVGSETRAWTEGRACVFDDSIEHEAWNRNPDKLRVVMIFDVWRPELSEAEQRLVSTMLQAVDAYGGGLPETGD